MKKIIIKIIHALTLILAMMLAEYRIIMTNIKPHLCGNIVTLEVFGQCDDYTYDEWK